MTAFITRALSDNSEFKKLLAAHGWQAEGRSLVELSPLPFQDIPAADWIFFSSKNAVGFFFQNIFGKRSDDSKSSERSQPYWSDDLKSSDQIEMPKVKWAALGAATAKVLAEYVGHVDFTGTGEPVGTVAAFRRFNPTPDPSPETSGRGDATYTVEYSSVRSTSPLPSGEGSGVGLNRRGVILFPAARHSRQSVISLLSPDFQCIHFPIYDNRPVENPPRSDADVLVFTSPMNAQAYFSKNSLAKNQRVVAIGETTAGALRELGIESVEIAREPNERGLAEAVLRLQG